MLKKMSITVPEEVYEILRRRAYMERTNMSNVISTLVQQAEEQKDNT